MSVVTALANVTSAPREKETFTNAVIIENADGAVQSKKTEAL